MALPASYLAGRRTTVRRFEQRVMGSRLSLTLTSDRVDDNGMEAAWAEVYDEFDASDVAMSRFRVDSDITRLNARAGTGALATVDRRLYKALAAADRAWRVTAGRFDPRVLADLERLGYRGAPMLVTGSDSGAQQVPVPSVTRPVVRRPREQAVALAAPLDLGGIGKGLALRWAWRRLTRRFAVGGMAGALLEAGGDLVAGGGSPDGGTWHIGLDDPTGGEAPLAVIGVEAGAVCTSSIEVNSWIDDAGHRAHHLIDPGSGEPGGEGLLSVTVATADPAWAEVWSKTLFLAGARRVAAEARGRGLAAWWVDDEGRMSMTPAARPMILWEA